MYVVAKSLEYMELYMYEGMLELSQLQSLAEDLQLAGVEGQMDGKLLR